MPSVGITDFFGATDPGYATEVTEEKSVEVATCRDATGKTVVALPKKLVTTTVTIKGKGSAPFDVAAGAFGATLKITEVKLKETNDDLPEYDVTYQKFGNS